jgi:Mn-dependent DtxR family transcriptional regulator
LTDFLKLLGLDARVIEHDVEGMEHHISPSTLRAIERLTADLRRRRGRNKTPNTKSVRMQNGRLGGRLGGTRLPRRVGKK